MTLKQLSRDVAETLLFRVKGDLMLEEQIVDGLKALSVYDSDFPGLWSGLLDESAERHKLLTDMKRVILEAHPILAETEFLSVN